MITTYYCVLLAIIFGIISIACLLYIWGIKEQTNKILNISLKDLRARMVHVEVKLASKRRICANRHKR